MGRKKPNRAQYQTFNEVGFRANQILLEGRDVADRDTLLVLVSHSFQSSLPYIALCEGISGKENMHIVLKTSSDNSDFRDVLEDAGYSVSDHTKKDYKTRPDKIIKEIKEALSERKLKKVLIMDHGGYASYHMQELLEELPISGIVEYTINGQNKFDEVFRLNGELRSKVPYISIGKSPLKLHPDISCGRLIGSLTQQAVEEFSGFSIAIRDFTQIGIVGFGTLGQAAALHLKTNGAENIMVHDIDEGRRTTAANQFGFSVVDNSEEGLIELLSRCNVIIVGTDKNPIPKHLWKYLKAGTITTGVTSGDDTWGYDKRIEDGTLELGKKMLRGKIRPLKMEDGRYIFALYDGESPNLAGSEIGVSDPTINLPTSLHMIMAWHIAKTGKVPSVDEAASYTKLVNASYNQAFFEMQEKARSVNGNGRLHI